MTEHPGQKRGRAVDVDEAFVQLLTAEQWRLRRYIASLLGDLHAANNVLQETNLLLWRKANEFRPGTSFFAWARTVAYWQVRAYVRDQRRDRHVFSEELIAQLNQHSHADIDESDELAALRKCMGRLSKNNLNLLRNRYEDRLSIAMIADHLGKTQSAVKMTLMRIRRTLLSCMEQSRPVSDATYNFARDPR